MTYEITQLIPIRSGNQIIEHEEIIRDGYATRDAAQHAADQYARLTRTDRDHLRIRPTGMLWSAELHTYVTIPTD